ncbi:tRNA/rRNA cytosine-C5-methylase, NOL1/NOP2/Sun family, containing RNA-binding PUA domain [Thermococcus kodakarensis KOD1]|uniref:tRNA (cytosine(72)-C(5))-methyltransferase n=1 Tax=Thermococcus kodakarensis (strain ATCC BAA-918 / JCM 12380 / KOD1) TaxID=69014 RepID=Q5JEW7_THEKO|nr:RsmB/NOP family class I SAM-dependent RNA methyltransferase [Thermococcus kodakarensis]WCN27972.1 RsmB/NOP family class I SAM-dependent RNA methyltransferase [Thermococcus kodakarensis]WCN30271.1 RsmB/NOP family class I SAM-dependent RNA methyltransferase [Thermococcus kodakarensis]BAD86311.1 tRNA/rRNA cytosine-C5-methylase, NOL1/NOP2/Sun family, containing RNA-binding PUA domain [Thermococcus kodakarensis KOD1]
MGYEEAFPAELREYYRKLFGSEAEEIMASLRTPVEKYYIRVNTLKTSRSELMRRLRREGLKPKRSPYLEEGIYFEREGPNFDDDYDPGLKKVVANKFASESVYQGAMLYAPGVLKADKGIKPGDEVEIRDPRGLLVGIGIARMSGKEMITATRGLAVEVTLPKFKLPSLSELESFKEGLFYAQSLPSMVASRVLEPSEEDLIIDMAAAPGGKTSHIAQLMQNRGEIIAIDKSRNRLRKMEEELKRLGVKNVRLIHMDARKLPELGIEADKILLDAPCTALGIRPKLWETRTPKDIEATARYQRAFIWAAIKSLRKGGTLVYSTCTISYEENEANVKYMLQKGLKLEEQSVFIASHGIDMEGVQRFYPNRHLTQGFFIAKLRKV